MNTLRRQILALFILIATVFLIAVVYTLFLLQQIGTYLDQLNQIYLPLSEDITQLEANTQMLSIDTQTSNTISEREMDRFKIDSRIVEKRLQRIAYLLKGISNKGEDLLVLEADIQLFQSQLDALRIQFQEIERSNTPKNVHRYFYIQTHLHVLSKKLIASSSNSIMDVGQQASLSRERAYSIGGGLGFVSLLLTIILSTIALRILSPIQRLTTQVQLIGKGDYSIRLSMSDFSGQEIAVLAREINNMAQAVEERDQSLSTRAEELNALSIQLEKVLHSISSGIIVVHNSRILLTNPVAQKDWGVDLGAELPQSLKDFDVGDYEEVDINGNICNITIVPLQNKEKLYSIRIVTEVVQSRKKLQRSERLALVGRLLAQVTHEVRNPLSSMHLNAEMLDDEDLSQEGLEIVTGLIYEIRRLEQITERYLDLSRRPPVYVEHVDLCKFLVDWVQEQRGLIFQKYQSECVIDIKEEIFVNIDKNVMRRALLNLTKNALEAKCQMIHLSTNEYSDSIELLIQDDGEGIGDKNSIFDAFYTTKSKGTGLGLAICRQEIEEIGGRLYCKQSQNPTVFGIMLKTMQDISS